MHSTEWRNLLVLWTCSITNENNWSTEIEQETGEVESKLGENGSSRKREIAFIIALDLSKQNTEKNIPLIDNANKAKDFCSKGVSIYYVCEGWYGEVMVIIKDFYKRKFGIAKGKVLTYENISWCHDTKVKTWSNYQLKTCRITDWKKFI